MAERLKFREADDPRDLIHQAVHRLVEGHLVSLPTEATEVVAAYSLHSEAVGRLKSLACSRTGSGEGRELVLGLKSSDEARDYLLDPPALVQRLMQRLWPGPVILALPVPEQFGLLRELPLPVQETLVRPLDEGEMEVWFRVSSHQVVQSVLCLLPAPLVFWEQGFSPDGLPPSEGDNSEVDLIIEDGPSHNQQKPSVVRASSQSWTLVEPGVVTETQINQMTGKVILFVCTGNTCRSPLAEGMFRKFLADRLGCSLEELPERGYTVLSAGLAAAEGAPAAPESVEVARKYGANLESHASQPLTDELLARADYVFTMTNSHRDSILYARPDVADRVLLLSMEELDIPDPIGGGWQEYETCGGEIARHLEALVDRLEPRPSES